MPTTNNETRGYEGLMLPEVSQEQVSTLIAENNRQLNAVDGFYMNGNTASSPLFFRGNEQQEAEKTQEATAFYCAEDWDPFELTY